MNFISVTGKNWELGKENNRKILQLCETHSISQTLSKLLVLRNIDVNDVNNFLYPEIDKFINSLNQLKGMNDGVSFIYDQIINYKVIGIFGDYDVDGASATSLLINFFKCIKVNYEFFIPDREIDGYGPTKNSFEKLIKKNVNSIITVDCGTVSFDAINFAKNKNINTLVIDHHQSETRLPEAFSIINPNRFDDSSGLNNLCATAITYFFIFSLLKKLESSNWINKNNIEKPKLFDYLDLVALATICDVVPLNGINRALVKKGLEIINKKKNIGLNELSSISNINEEINSYHLGFLLGPRINAGGRLGQPTLGTKLLSTSDKSLAIEISKQMNDLNDKRKTIESIHLDEVRKLAKKYKNDDVLVLYKKDWNEGVMGILASRIKEEFKKPTLILTKSKDKVKCSARSIYGFNIGLEIMNCITLNTIISGGGHKMAGGFTMLYKNISKLRTYLNHSFKNKKINTNILNKIFIDSRILINSISEDLYKEINLLAPYGSGNPSPNFLIEDLLVSKFFILKEKHISCILSDTNGKYINCIAFNSVGTEIGQYISNKNKKKIDIVGKLSENVWNGKKKIQFIIKDVGIKGNLDK